MFPERATATTAQPRELHSLSQRAAAGGPLAAGARPPRFTVRHAVLGANDLRREELGGGINVTLIVIIPTRAVEFAWMRIMTEAT